MDAQDGPDECTSYVLQAAAAENRAIEFDRAGSLPEALEAYEECEGDLAKAIAAALPAHPGDHPKLVQHREEVLARIKHLKSLKGSPSTVPVEDHIKAIQLGMQASAAAAAGTQRAGGAKTMAACAALGAVGGFLVLGSIPMVPATAAAVAGAAGATYAATRSDKLGDAARAAGGVVVSGAEKAAELNREHKITEKVADAGKKAAERAKEVDTKFGISTKVAAGVTGAMNKAKEVESKHHVTDKVASGVSSGLSKLSGVLSKGTAGSAASGASAAMGPTSSTASASGTPGPV